MEAYTKKSQLACGFPDVCRVPAPPAGPVPVPYPTLQDVHVGRFKGTTKKVKIRKKGVPIRSSYAPSAKGDEAGKAGGVVSGGKLKASTRLTCPQCGAKTHRPAFLPLSVSGRGSARVEVCVDCYKKQTGGGYPLPAK